MSRADVTLGANTRNFRRGIDGAKRQLQGFKALASGGFSFGQALGAAALLTTVKKLADEMDRFHKLSLRLGVSAEILQRWSQVAKKSGADVEQLVRGIQRANLASRQAADGSKLMGDAFDRLGINAAEFSSLDPEGQFLALSDAVAKSASSGEALANVQTIMGGRAAELIPLLQQGSSELQKQFADVAVLSDDAVNDIANVNDTFSDMFNTIKVKGASILSFLLDGFKRVVAGATQIVIEVINGLGRVGEIIKEFLTGNFEEAARLSDRHREISAGNAQRISDAYYDLDKQRRLQARQRKKEADEERERGVEKELAIAREAAAAKKLDDLIEKRIKAEKELADIQQKAREAEMSSLDKIVSAQMNIRDLTVALKIAEGRKVALSVGDDELAKERNLANIAKYKLELEKQNAILKTESANNEQEQAEERRAAAQSNLDTLNEMVEQNEALRNEFQRNADGFAGTIDNLTAVGIGVANTTTEQPNEQKALLNASLSANRFLEQINDNVREQELVLEEDDF